MLCRLLPLATMMAVVGCSSKFDDNGDNPRGMNDTETTEEEPNDDPAPSDDDDPDSDPDPDPVEDPPEEPTDDDEDAYRDL